MRVATAPSCREALDSLIGLDHPTAWELREACLELWPASAIKSLGVLVRRARQRAADARARAAPGQHLAAQAGGESSPRAHLNPTVMAAWSHAAVGETASA